MPRKVEVVADDPAWPELFCAGAERLRRVFAAELLVIHRLEHEPRPTGSAAGVLPDMGRMLPRYYALRGWDEEGVPTEAALLPTA